MATLLCHECVSHRLEPLRGLLAGLVNSLAVGCGLNDRSWLASDFVVLVRACYQALKDPELFKSSNGGHASSDGVSDFVFTVNFCVRQSQDL